MKATSKYRNAMISVGRWPDFQNEVSVMSCSLEHFRADR
jgi:hypothetical protein